MKNTLLKTLALALLALLAHFTTVVGQTPEPRPARQQLQAYYQLNVLPVLRQQRQKLEAQLSTDDQSQLATYRAQLHAVRQRGHALRQSLRSASPGTPRPALTEAQRQQHQQLRAESRRIMLNVAQLAQKHEAAIAQLLQEIRPQQDKWTADIQAIAAKSTPAGQPENAARPARMHHHGGLGGYMRPARFLLLNPAAGSAAEPVSAGSTVFPNPAAATSQLSYVVKKAGPVTVEVLDGRGTVLRTLVAGETREKGPHTVSANVSELPAGTYFYKVTTRAGVETKRFVKQ
ncbi:Por secretion system C-terminal sorting domain-containing protein [Hymenobacter daecheongensis DSM 21074]|uniref:Por secretion system C-terminal sorting domain-containing protein n=1 Tax=Hymenobacter daecheongensis DSM 21074 TaxID=1121955 RepID=A0A1M6LT27_9BACT|nr:T9SS type A sorting domain-containing protein [Hymenobacter daecheongensis]SHJ74367.1 Por secretion system C-terminal sorting domain-containing protein [Hymenobacter daecheongensis DSM 21074]